MADYHAAHLTIDAQLSDPTPDQVQRLIDQFVLIGLPARYTTSLDRRPTERGRMLVRQVRDLTTDPPKYS